jgi:hypothetical protein
MRSPIRATLAAVLLLVSATAGMAAAAPLTPKQQKVLDYLLADWGVDTSVTGVDLAMKIVGGNYTSEDRYALAVHIREHPELHRVLRRFGWEAVALDPEEKLIARQLSRAQREKLPAPSLGDLTRSVGVPSPKVKNGLQMLERLGIIRRDPAAVGVGYRMTSERYVHWEGLGRIDFMYHRVNVEGLKTLDTY